MSYSIVESNAKTFMGYIIICVFKNKLINKSTTTGPYIFYSNVQS